MACFVVFLAYFVMKVARFVMFLAHFVMKMARFVMFLNQIPIHFAKSTDLTTVTNTLRGRGTDNCHRYQLDYEKGSSGFPRGHRASWVPRKDERFDVSAMILL